MKKSLREIAEGNVRTEAGSIKDSERLIEQYSGMSENELLRELISVTNRQKADGSFDAEALSKGIDAIAPMLTEEQRRRLNEIAGLIG